MIDQLLWLTSVFFWVHNLNSCHMIIPDVTLSCKYLSQILVSFSCQVTWWSCLGNFRTQNSCFNHVLTRLLNLRVKPHVQALGVWNCSIRKTNKNFVIWILIPNEPSLDTATFYVFSSLSVVLAFLSLHCFLMQCDLLHSGLRKHSKQARSMKIHFHAIHYLIWMVMVSYQQLTVIDGIQLIERKILFEGCLIFAFVFVLGKFLIIWS
jgi:hypothetical protein